MLAVKKRRNSVSVGTRNYVATVDYRFGGTLRRLVWRGVDTGLIREGCEYWRSDGDGRTHYEQEFGALHNISVQERPDSVRVVSTAGLVSPQLQREGFACVGGEGVTRYDFYEDRIISESVMRPVFGYRIVDKYICWAPTAYQFVNGVPIGNPDTSGWWRAHVSRPCQVSSATSWFGIDWTDGEIMAAVYRSETMLEVKPEYRDNQVLRMEYRCGA